MHYLSLDKICFGANYFYKIDRKKITISKDQFKKLRNVMHLLDINVEHRANDIIWKVRLIIQSFDKNVPMNIYWKEICVLMNE